MAEALGAGLTGPYRQQIDGLRAIAVMGVLYTHFWDEGTAWGTLGVRLFFVISGYLITGILLAARENAGNGKPQALAWFYIRRGLRIWPIYFLVLAISAIVAPSFWPALPWHATFLSNLYFMREGEWRPWPTAHLWSLSVEEQFYLIWPLLVLFAPRRTLPAIFIATIGIAIAYRATISLFWPQLDFPNIATHMFRKKDRAKRHPHRARGRRPDRSPLVCSFRRGPRKAIAAPPWGPFSHSPREAGRRILTRVISSLVAKKRCFSAAYSLDEMHVSAFAAVEGMCRATLKAEAQDCRQLTRVAASVRH